MAMGMVDRFLSKSSSIAQGALRDRNQFQLVAIAALSICIKTNEKMILGSEFLATVARNIYSANEIKDMELNILEGLQSGIHAPTSIQMARHFLSLALPGVNLEESRWSFILGDVWFQIEHAVRDYYFTMQWPRTVAMAAILNCLDQVTGQDHQVLLRVLPTLVSKNFPSLTDLLAAKNRLRDVMERDGFADDVTVAPETPIESLDKSLADMSSLLFERGTEEAPLRLLARTV